MASIAISSGIPPSTLDGGIDNAVTSLDVAAGDGTNFPTVPFKIGIESECMLVTARATDTFTVMRSFDGTTAAAHSDGVALVHAHSAQDFPFRLDDTSDDYIAQRDIDLNGKILLGPLDPTGGTQVGDRDYNDGRYADSDTVGAAFSELMLIGA